VIDAVIVAVIAAVIAVVVIARIAIMGGLGTRVPDGKLVSEQIVPLNLPAVVIARIDAWPGL
jgi:hypothetical protein